MSLTESLSLYHRILSSAVSIRDRSAEVLDDKGVNVASSTQEDLSRLSLPALTLPLTSSILQSLLDKGIRNDVAEKLSFAFDRAIENLRDETQTSFTKAWSQLVFAPRFPSMIAFENLHSQLRASYIAVYLRKVEKWKLEVQQRAIGQREALRQKSGLMSDTRSAKSSTGVRPSFNNDYLPILEAFFAEEQFPSRADKLFLARKSGMEYRQIHVWFQNRRSRTKKSPCLSSSMSTTQLAQSNAETDIDDEPHEISSRSSSFTLVSDGDSFFWPTPPHAFPAKYPPNFDEVPDPFHCRFGDFSGFPKLAWRRMPSSCTTVQNDCDVSTLIEAFAKLRIGSEPAVVERNEATRLWGSYTPRRRTGYDVTMSYTTHTYRAPLASLIRFPSRHNRLKPCPIFRPNWCNALPFAKGDLVESSQGSRTESIVSTEESSGSTSDTSPSDTNTPVRARMKGRKKVSGPPRRTPANRPHLRVEAQSETLRSLDAPCVSSSILPSMKSTAEQGTHDSGNDFENISLRHGQLRSSYSSSSTSSSESHSPSTPSLDFFDESPFSFETSLETSRDPPTSFAASKSISEGAPHPLFLSTGSTLDQSLLNLSNEDSFDFALPQFVDNNIFPSPASYESTLPTALPFSFDFSSLLS